jgi:hypothetical protein
MMDMLTITGFGVQLINDPFGIIEGERYEFFLDIEVPEDDEVYSEKGLYIKVLYRVQEDQSGIVKYDIFEKETEKHFDFDLQEDEEALVETFCKEHLPQTAE